MVAPEFFVGGASDNGSWRGRTLDIELCSTRGVRELDEGHPGDRSVASDWKRAGGSPESWSSQRPGWRCHGEAGDRTEVGEAGWVPCIDGTRESGEAGRWGNAGVSADVTRARAGLRVGLLLGWAC